MNEGDKGCTHLVPEAGNVDNDPPDSQDDPHHCRGRKQNHKQKQWVADDGKVPVMLAHDTRSGGTVIGGMGWTDGARSC